MTTHLLLFFSANSKISASEPQLVGMRLEGSDQEVGIVELRSLIDVSLIVRCGLAGSKLIVTATFSDKVGRSYASSLLSTLNAKLADESIIVPSGMNGGLGFFED